jgi:TonB family protein
VTVATEDIYSPITLEPADQFRDRKDRKHLWRAIADSVALHGLLLALLFGLWHVPPVRQVVFPNVTIKVVGTGAAGSAGGSGGSARLPGERNAGARLSASASPPTPSATARPASDAAPPLPAPLPKPEPTIVTRNTAPPKPRHERATAHSRVAPIAAPAPKPAPNPAATIAAIPLAAPTPQPSATQAATAGNPSALGTGMTGVGSAGNGNFGISQGTGGAGRGSGSPDDYLDRVRRHLEQYKRYPEVALKNKEEGTVTVAFTVAHDGTVTKAWIAHSSGNPLLDEAALAMLHDGSPVPPVPEQYWDRSGPIIMPVNFSIGLLNRLLR